MATWFTPSNSVLWVVDVQTRMMSAVRESELVITRVGQLLEAAVALGIPYCCSEQYPQGLGPTVPALQAYLQQQPAIEKTTFGAFANPEQRAILAQWGRSHVVVCGVEAHVCVAQTVLQGLAAGYTVGVVVDAVSSRHKQDAKMALRRLEQQGAQLLTTESILFEWLGDAKNPQFKAIQALVK
ncbi:MAG: isochorismatase family protein [Vampirovibrionales bacterium]